jgi:hypothetical protein
MNLPFLNFFELLKQKISALKISTKIIFLFMGISSTLWFLIRVIPKPQRAAYPCMRAAAPVMSGFVLYLLSLGGMTLFFRSAVSKLKQAKYLTAAFSLLACLILLVVFNWNSAQNAYSKTVGFTRGILPDAPNSPMGTGIGVLPGRVVWSWDPDATNGNCKNTISDAFFMAKNNNNAVIDEMMDSSIKKLAGKDNVKEAWDAIFKNFNERKTGTASGYSEGQTIFIKVNNGQAGWAINMSDLSETGTTSQMTGLKNAAMAGTTPSTVLAIVRELVDDCQIPQENILIGEPMTHVYKSMYDAIHKVYPKVKILDKDGYTTLGRTKSEGWTDNVIYYSDNGDLMPDAFSDNIMKEMYDADYMINAAALKAHARNGVSLNAKLHFGSHGDHPGGYGYGSFYLHAGLICTVDNDVMTSGLRGEYGMYRVLVDLMGHENIGGNTVLFLVDGLWGGVEATDMPVKWGMEPFKTDFPSSIFVSQDGVAIESVCLDFLRAEADKNRLFNDRPFFPAVDDHLHQAADKANWPKDLVYDPEGDGVEIPSLGVHEHWNNPTDKQYSKNLGTGQGIELIKILKGQVTGIKDLAQNDIHLNLFPNPCIENTTLSYTLETNSKVSVSLISADGKNIQLVKDEYKNSGINMLPINTSQLVKGLYLCRLETNSGASKNRQTIKLIVQ